jgi:hypothetical protein
MTQVLFLSQGWSGTFRGRCRWRGDALVGFIVGFR